MRKKSLYLFLMIIALCFSFFAFNNNVIHAEGDEDLQTTTQTQITKLADLKPEGEGNVVKGKFILMSDLTIGSNNEGSDTGDGEVVTTGSWSSYIFSGDFDGNGKTITIESGNLFDRITDNANVYNLKICLKNQEMSSTVQNLGVLANVIENSNIYGIKFNYEGNSNVQIKVTSKTLLDFNFGLVAGKISNSKVHQISLMGYTVDLQAIGNINAGLLVGMATNGSVVKDTIVENVSIKAEITNVSGGILNFSSLIGYAENSIILNNIIKLEEANEMLFDSQSNINYGTVVGGTIGSSLRIINNAVYDLSLIEVQPAISNNIGAVVGYSNTPVSLNNLNGVLYNKNINLVGNLEDLTSDADKITLKNNAQFVSAFNDNDTWVDLYEWNTNSIWLSSQNQLPKLQYFENFKIAFSSLNSLKSLGVKDIPNEKDSIEFTIKDGLDEKSNNISTVSYGDFAVITVCVKEDYSKFFKISGLLLNNEMVFAEENSQLNNSNITCSKETKNNVDTFIYKIENFNANLMGVYSVKLTRIEYDLSIQVIADEINSQKVFPGKIKSDMASIGSTTLENIKLKYGEIYSYNTYEVGNDYAKEADWYPTMLSGDLTSDVSNILDLQTNFETMSRLEWTFNENCILFDKTSTHLDINSYSEGENKKTFVIYVLYTKDVQEVQIIFKDVDGNIIKDYIADIAIDNGNIETVFVDGVYTTKIRYGKTEHVLILKNLSTKYAFEGWEDSSASPLPKHNEDELSCVFRCEDTDGDESFVLVINGIFKQEKVAVSSNNIWIWIVGSLVLIAVLVVIIILLKRKKSNKDYKKYMYY